MNIRFTYLYRDSANYKNWGEIVFTNPSDVAPDAIASCAGRVLIDGAWFVATNAAVPDLHFPRYDEQLDHGWHEVHAFQSTDDAPTDHQQRNIEEFLNALRVAALI